MNATRAAVRKPPSHWLPQFLELQIPMVLGALVCYLLGRLIPAYSSFATAYYPGSYLYTSGDILFLTGPVLVWIVFRGYGWRFGLEVAGAMLAPVIVIMAAGQLAGYDYLAWLTYADYPAMSVGMAAAIIYDRQGHARGA